MLCVSILTPKHSVPFTYDMLPGIWVRTHVRIQFDVCHLHLSNSSSHKAPQHVLLLIKLNCTGKAFVIFSLCVQGEGEIISPSKSTDSIWINQFGCLECRFLSPSKSTHLQFLLLFQLMEFRAGEFLQKTL